MIGHIKANSPSFPGLNKPDAHHTPKASEPDALHMSDHLSTGRHAARVPFGVTLPNAPHPPFGRHAARVPRASKPIAHRPIKTSPRRSDSPRPRRRSPTPSTCPIIPLLDGTRLACLARQSESPTGPSKHPNARVTPHAQGVGARRPPHARSFLCWTARGSRASRVKANRPPADTLPT